MFLLQNALKNIWRQRRRYRVLLPLILVCALLTGVFMTVAVPCRQYSDRIITVAYDFTEEEAAAVEERQEKMAGEEYLERREEAKVAPGE